MLDGSTVSSGDQVGRSFGSCMKRFSTLRLSASRGFEPPTWRRMRVSAGRVEATETREALSIEQRPYPR